MTAPKKRRTTETEEQSTLTVTEAPAETAEVPREETPAPAPAPAETGMTEAVLEALGTPVAGAPPTLFDVRDGTTVRWYLMEADGPSVERAWAVYRTYRPVPRPQEFLTIVGTAVGDMGRVFSLVSRMSL